MGLILTDDQKSFIVKGFARFESGPEICRAFKEKYGVELPTPRAAQYNCGGPSFKGAQKWQELFIATRRHFLDSAEDIGITNKTFRLQSLHKLHAVAMDKRNVKMACEILEQAAKEMGEVFTNKREIKSDVRSLTATMTTDELRNEILADLKALGVDAPASLAGPPAPLQVGVVRDKDKDKLN
jgi:hypothetical protein